MDREKLLELFKVMARIRAFENESIELAKANETRAAVHTYIGQEAIAVGMCAHMSDQDLITSTHRGHGHCIAKGADLTKMFAELLGRETGYCKGKGGSMHIADLSTGNLGANGIVGGGIPIATGAALGLLLKGSAHFVVCFFGDGAINEGSFHESVNLASVWNLPIIYVCENNQFGISTHVSQSSNVEDLSVRAKAYGIPGYSVNGNDVIEVYNKTTECLEHIKAKKGPVLLEMKTYRISGHYFGDNENYRNREDVSAWKEKDPLLHCRTVLVNEYGLTAEQLDEIEQTEEKLVLEASSIAKTHNEPSPDQLLEDLYDPSFDDVTWIPFKKEGVKK